MYINNYDEHGGKRFDFQFSYELKDMLLWYREHRMQLDKELAARTKYESVASAYDQYQTTLKLVLSSENP